MADDFDLPDDWPIEFDLDPFLPQPSDICPPFVEPPEPESFREKEIPVYHHLATTSNVHVRRMSLGRGLKPFRDVRRVIAPIAHQGRRSRFQGRYRFVSIEPALLTLQGSVHVEAVDFVSSDAESAHDALYNYWNRNDVSNDSTTYFSFSSDRLLVAKTNLRNGIPDSVRGRYATSDALWYWEVEVTAHGAHPIHVGVISGRQTLDATAIGTTPESASYSSEGEITANATVVANVTPFGIGDIIGVALDASTGRVWFALNGSWLQAGDPANSSNEIAVITTDFPIHPAVTFTGSGDAVRGNFGQDAFISPVPTGFSSSSFAWPTASTDPTHRVIQYSGNDAITRTVSGIGFEPDLVIVKERQSDADYRVFDSEMDGSFNWSLSQSIKIETNGRIVASAPDGFTTGGNDPRCVNEADRNYICWAWQKSLGSFEVITANNPSIAGSITEHPLGLPPKMMMFKSLTDMTQPMYIWMDTMQPGWALQVNSNQRIMLRDIVRTYPDDKVIVWGGEDFVGDYRIYLWADNPNASSHFSTGTYIGTNSDDGPIVTVGFSPKMLWIKSNSVSNQGHALLDQVRDPINPADHVLPTVAPTLETVSHGSLDFAPTGFRMRLGNRMNTLGSMHYYAAWS